MQRIIIGLLVVSCLLITCPSFGADPTESTIEILITSEAGDKQAKKENLPLQAGRAEGTVIEIVPEQVKQTIDGIGTSFTESSAYVLAHLEPTQRREVMNKLFSSEGADFSLCRTHIGACDFCVEGRYSYDDVAGDVALENFSICLLYTSPSPRDGLLSRMPSSA